MVKNLPDKHVRKAVFDAVNNIVVDSQYIKCYDKRMTGSKYRNYILIKTQSNEVLSNNKCEKHWESQVLIEVFTRYSITGNTGSRLLADNILDKVRANTDELVLDLSSNLKIIQQSQSFPSDLQPPTENEIIYRKFIRIEMLIN